MANWLYLVLLTVLDQVKLEQQAKIIELELVKLLEVKFKVDFSLPYSNSSLIKSNRVKLNLIKSIQM